MKRILTLMLLAIFSTSAVSAEEVSSEPAKGRPKVGVVLSGGGAKGLAHIGALKVIEEAGIKVDYIVGTSIGSIMAGIYALGYSADEMDTLVRTQNWDLLMRDQRFRTDVSYTFKEDADRYLFTLPFMNHKMLTQEAEAGSGKPKGLLRNIPAALVEGQNLNQLFTKLSVGYQDDIDFNDLPIPFACVAVDLNTKEEVVWHSGDIVTAIRSSMSIPGYFVPVHIGDQYLVDGGMLNNLPVDVVRKMGADIVITVDLHHFDEKQRPDSDQTIPEMVGTLLSIMNGAKYQAGREDSDILIEPNTGSFGILAFDDYSVNALIDSGYVAGSRVREQLEELGDRLASYSGPERMRPPRAINLNRDSVLISQLEVSGTDASDIAWLLARTDIEPGKYITGEDMDKAMAFFYNTKCFSKAGYSVSGNELEGYRLKIKLQPERVHQAGIGFRFDSQEFASILLGVNLNKRRLFGHNLDIMFELGSNANANIAYGYVFRNLTRFNVSVRGAHQSIDLYDDVVTYEEIEKGKDFRWGLNSTDRYTYLTARTDYQITSWRSSIIDFGLQFDYYRCLVVNATDQKGSGFPFTGRDFRTFGSWNFDSLDDGYFPTRGAQFQLKGSVGNPFYDKGSLLNNSAWSFEGVFDFKVAIPLGKRVVLIPQTYNRWVFGAPDRFRRNHVGGLMGGRYLDQHMPFVGINYTYQTADWTDIFRTDLRVNLFRQHYLTLIGNYMAEWRNDNPGFTFTGHYGVGASYSINTIVGPVSLTAHYSNLSRSFGVYFALGYDF